MKLPHYDATPGALRFVRALVFGVWFLRVAFKPLYQLALIPDSLYQPVGLLALLPAAANALLRHEAFLYGLQAAALLSFVLVIVGIGGRAAMVAACVLMTLFASLWRGFAGHIDHESILILFAGYLLTLCSLADARAAAKGERIPSGGPTAAGIPLTATLAVLCFVYTMVGVFRLVHGAPGVFTSGSLTFWALRNAHEAVNPVGEFGKLVTGYPMLARMLELGFPVVTLVEVTALLALFSRWYRYAFLAVMVPFHVLSLFVLDVFFWENMVLYVLFFELGRPGAAEGGGAAGE